MGIIESARRRFGLLPPQNTYIFDLIGTLIPDEYNPKIREGVPELFREYQRAGHNIIVATSASTLEAQYWIEEAGIEDVVTESKGVKTSSHGKEYREIIKNYGLSDEQAQERVLITGDMLGDRPADIGDVVFVHDVAGYENHAHVHRVISSRLQESGKGSFREGFDQLSHSTSNHTYDMGDGVRVVFNTRQSHHSERQHLTIPMVQVFDINHNKLHAAVRKS